MEILHIKMLILIEGECEHLDKKIFLEKFKLKNSDLENYNIEWSSLMEIYQEFISVIDQFETQANFIANTLRTQKKVHTVRSRVKDPEHLIAKLIRKTPSRQSSKNSDFQFSVDNYKDEITDLIGVRAIHIFKEDWEEIHNFITSTWNTTEIAANVRDGDNKEKFKKLNISINSRETGYRSVHYLIEFYPTAQKVICEIQVRTIFEEGYGEIDHQLRYPHGEVPDILSLNLLMLNRVAGSSDEMASYLHQLNQSWSGMENEIKEKNHEIARLRNEIEKSNIDDSNKKSFVSGLNRLNYNSFRPIVGDSEVLTHTLKKLSDFYKVNDVKDNFVQIPNYKELISDQTRNSISFNNWSLNNDVGTANSIMKGYLPMSISNFDNKTLPVNSDSILDPSKNIEKIKTKNTEEESQK